jgi:putative SOS response-associated peptidase YedK
MVRADRGAVPETQEALSCHHVWPLLPTLRQATHRRSLQYRRHSIQPDHSCMGLQRRTYDIPTHHPADRETGNRELVLMRWGLVPFSFFTKQLSDVKGVSTINARAETVEESPTWRTPFKKRRCLVPADGFYEWLRVDPKNKQPFAFRMANDAPFAFAGLWDAWREPDGGWVQSFSIITTEANELMSPIHTRMPVILHPRDYDRWLAREGTRPPLELLRPF